MDAIGDSGQDYGGRAFRDCLAADDGEVIEFSQRGFAQEADGETVCELGGRGQGGADHNVTETLIRSMYGYYREVMEL